eukprot:1182711-Rhodomonas_salina.2
MARPWQLRFILFFIETLFFCPRGLSTLCIDHGEVCSRGLSAPIPSFRGQIHLYLRGAGQNPGSGTSTRQLPRKKHEGQEQAAGDIKARLNDLAKRVRDPQWTEVIGLLPSLARKDPSLSNAIDGAVPGDEMRGFGGSQPAEHRASTRDLAQPLLRKGPSWKIGRDHR